MKIFKILFSIVFFAFTILWILYTVSFIGVWSGGMEWAEKLPLVKHFKEWVDSQIQQASYAGAIKYFGLWTFMVGGAILLGYTAIVFPLKKIPFLGWLIKILTFIVPTIGAIMFIVGAILLFGNVEHLLPQWLKDAINKGSDAVKPSTYLLNVTQQLNLF